MRIGAEADTCTFFRANAVRRTERAANGRHRCGEVGKENTWIEPAPDSAEARTRTEPGFSRPGSFRVRTVPQIGRAFGSVVPSCRTMLRTIGRSGPDADPDRAHEKWGPSNKSRKSEITPARMNSGRGEIIEIRLVRQTAPFRAACDAVCRSSLAQGWGAGRSESADVRSPTS